MSPQIARALGLAAGVLASTYGGSEASGQSSLSVPLTFDTALVDFREAQGLENAECGASVLVTENYLHVGCPGPGPSGDAPGMILVFRTESGHWWLDRRIDSPIPEPGARFGETLVRFPHGWIAIGAPGASKGAGSVYTCAAGGAFLQITEPIANPSPAAGDHFGASLAAADGFLLVGAPGKDTTRGVDSGEAYVFEGSQDLWDLNGILESSEAGPGARLGAAVAITTTTAAVGSPFATAAAGLEGGAVFIFPRTAGAWASATRILASNGQQGDQFGASLALSGDRLLVGAPRVDRFGDTDRGSLYVFQRNQVGFWSEGPELAPSEPFAGARFGTVVSLCGARGIVGSPLHGPTGSGKAYLLEATELSWSVGATLESVFPQPASQLGSSASCFNSQFLVGAPGERLGGATSGAGFLFGLDGSQQDRFSTEGTETNTSAFGSAGATTENYAMVGASLHSHLGRPATGSLHLFRREAAGWVLADLFWSPNPSDYGQFGAAVAMTPNWAAIGSGSGPIVVLSRNGGQWSVTGQIEGLPGTDFNSTLVAQGDLLFVGVPSEAADGGAVYVYQVVDGEPQLVQRLTSPAPFEHFGGAIAATAQDLLVGQSGRNWSFRRSGGVWGTPAELTAIDPGIDFLPISVAIEGDLALVGHHAYGQLSGRVYVFKRSGSTWNQIQTLTPSVPESSFAFGYRVGLSGGFAYVSMIHEQPGPDGVIEVFRIQEGTWQRAQRLVSTDPRVESGFGSAIWTSGSDLWVGLPQWISGRASVSVFASRAESRFHTVAPCRLVDTREEGQGPHLTSGAARAVVSRGHCGIPDTAKALALSVTATGATSSGHLTLHAANTPAPGTSNLSFSGGQTRASSTIIAVGPDRAGDLVVNPVVADNGTVHVILDVTGYFE